MIIPIEEATMIEDLLIDLENILLPYKKYNKKAAKKDIIETSISIEPINNKKDYTIKINTNRTDIYDSQGLIIIDGKEYDIAHWWNLEALIKGGYKATDYLLNYLGFNTDDFNIKDHTNEIQ